MTAVVVVDEMDEEAPWKDSSGISWSGNGGDIRSYWASSCVHLMRLSRLVVWYGGVVPCIRSCSARMVSVNDGYFELDGAVVAAAVVRGGGRGDLVVTALED